MEQLMGLMSAGLSEVLFVYRFDRGGFVGFTHRLAFVYRVDAGFSRRPFLGFDASGLAAADDASAGASHDFDEVERFARFDHFHDLSRAVEAARNSNFRGKAFEEFVRGHDTIAQLCREQGARLILVSAPVYQTYQYRISDVVLQEMKLVADSLNKLYHNVEYYNFFFAEGFDDEDFYDSGHLTETGAIKFSKMLSDTISLHFSFGNPEKSLYLCTDF